MSISWKRYINNMINVGIRPGKGAGYGYPECVYPGRVVVEFAETRVDGKVIGHTPIKTKYLGDINNDVIKNPCPAQEGSKIHALFDVRTRITPEPKKVQECLNCPYHKMAMRKTGEGVNVCIFMEVMEEFYTRNPDALSGLSGALDTWMENEQKEQVEINQEEIALNEVRRKRKARLYREFAQGGEPK